jgi:hypothetical protein
MPKHKTARLHQTPPSVTTSTPIIRDRLLSRLELLPSCWVMSAHLVTGLPPLMQTTLYWSFRCRGRRSIFSNGTAYGDGSGSGKGYLNNAQLMAGQMEYALAANSVPLTGGTLTLQSGLSNGYKNANFGTDGQYRFQVIRGVLRCNA